MSREGRTSPPGGARDPAPPGGARDPAPPGGARDPAPPGGAHDPSSPRGARDPSPPRAARDPSPRPDAARPLRLFVALDLPAAVRAALTVAGAAADPDVWRAVAPQSLHVTLAFLGPRPPAGADTVAEIVAAEHEGPAPRLALARALLLPPRRARVLTVAIDDPDGTLAALQARLSQRLADAGVYTPEQRPFRAHVTIARLRPRARAPRSIELPLERIEFAGEAVTLYVSRLHPAGARYEPLGRAALV